jgi:tRNA threonylcarbamoyladenosine modification (KEOPS) complex Cgi121 subunit
MNKKIGSFFARAELGKADIKDAESVIKKLSESAKNSVFLQVFNAKTILSTEQLFFAAKQAIDATKNQSAFSQRLEIELLLRATATRQINQTLKTTSLQKGKQETAILAVSESENALEETIKEIKKELCFKSEKTTELSKEKKQEIISAFGITKKELEAIKDLGKGALENAVKENIAMNALNE